MTPEQRHAYASLGGKSVPPEKRSFSTNPQLASTAGKKGGLSVPPEKRSFFRDPALAAEAGRRGSAALHSRKVSE